MGHCPGPRVTYSIGHLSLNKGSSLQMLWSGAAEFEFLRLVFGKSWLLLTLKISICRRGLTGDDTALLFTFEYVQDGLFLYSIFQLAHRSCMPGCEYCSVRFLHLRSLAGLLSEIDILVSSMGHLSSCVRDHMMLEKTAQT